MTAATLATPVRPMNVQTTLNQIGRMTLFAISGGRFGAPFREADDDRLAKVITLPVSNGYFVRITLAAPDTYTVERVFKRSGKFFVKGAQSHVFAENLSEVCYSASCFRNVEFGS